MLYTGIVYICKVYMYMVYMIIYMYNIVSSRLSVWMILIGIELTSLIN